MLEDHAALGAFIGFQSGVTSLVVAQGHGVWERLTAFLASENAFLGMGYHVLGYGHPELEVLAAQGAVVRLFCCIAAVVVPQLIHCREDPLTLCTLETSLLHHLQLLLWRNKLLLLLFMFVSVFNEAAAVLKGKATFFTGEGRELVLVRVEVAVKVERLAPVERLPTLFAHQTALFWLDCHIGVVLSVRLVIILDHILHPLDFSHQLLLRDVFIGVRANLLCSS